MTDSERQEAIKIIKSECYISDLLDFDRTRMVNTALDTVIKALETVPCEDCISRTELLKKKQIIIDEHGLEHKIVHIGKIIDAPSVEPERKKGHWIIHSDDLFPSESTQECSECHEHQPLDWRHSDNYCPNCGADMREVQDGTG